MEEKLQRNKSLIGPKFYKEWHISIDVNRYSIISLLQIIEVIYLMNILQYGLNGIKKNLIKSIILNNIIIKINDNIEYSMGYYS